MAVHQVMSLRHHMVAVVMEQVLVLLLWEVKDTMLHHHHSVHKLLYKHMLLMLKVSLSTKTHKSSVVQLLVVYKHTHKISKFDSFNHPLFHLQA